MSRPSSDLLESSEETENDRILEEALKLREEVKTVEEKNKKDLATFTEIKKKQLIKSKPHSGYQIRRLFELFSKVTESVTMFFDEYHIRTASQSDDGLISTFVKLDAYTFSEHTIDAAGLDKVEVSLDLRNLSQHMSGIAKKNSMQFVYRMGNFLVANGDPSICSMKRVNPFIEQRRKIVPPEMKRIIEEPNCSINHKNFKSICSETEKNKADLRLFAFEDGIIFVPMGKEEQSRKFGPCLKPITKVVGKEIDMAKLYHNAMDLLEFPKIVKGIEDEVYSIKINANTTKALVKISSVCEPGAVLIYMERQKKPLVRFRFPVSTFGKADIYIANKVGY